MPRILMILAFCSLAQTTHSQAQFTPAIFNLQGQFNQCIADAPETPYATCQKVLRASYTLRREIGNAFQSCLTTDAQGCVEAFNTAGLPAGALGIATLKGCVRLKLLDKIDWLILPEGSCIEQIAQTIENRSIPTSHKADIPCGFISIECQEIVGLGAKYWESAVWLLYHEKLQAVLNSEDLANDDITRHRYYSLLERQRWLQTELAKTTCHLATIMPHRANKRDFDGCMGKAYADMWVALKEGKRD